MTSHKLDNLVKIGQLKAEPGSQSEFDGLLHSAKARLTDARNETLSVESRFDLAYNASHALAASTAFVPKIAILFFRCSNIRWALPRKYGVCWRSAIRNEILPSMKVISKSTINFLWI